MKPQQESVRRAAHIAGLHSFETPTLEAVERRRLQLWILTLLLLTTVAVGVVVFTFWIDVRPPGWMSPRILQGALLGLVALFCVYAIEKELQLRRLTVLLVEEKVLTAALTSRLEELKALLEAGKALNLDLDLQQVLSTILKSSLDLLGGHDASIMLVHGEQRLRTVAATGRSAARGASIRFGEGIAGKVAESREPLLITGAVDRSSQAAVKPVPPPRSAMCVPLLHRDSLLGVLNVNAAGERTYTEYDLRALSLFGEQAATAIVNAQLYEAERLTASQSSYRALHDPLTNLPNRALFLDRVGHALSRRRVAERMVALLFLDINGFKQINDSLGHTAGDQVLVGFAERVRLFLRSEDTVARFGGDEFAVLLEGLSSEEEAEHTAERLLRTVGEPFAVGDRELTITANIGIAVEGPGGTSAQDLVQNADTALHAAHEKGAIVVFREEMRSDVLRRFNLEHELARAFKDQELTVYYQPIFHLERRRLVGAEALLRWQHPTRGLLPAAVFVPSAEQAGLLPTIDLWTLEKSCRLGKSLIGSGSANHNFLVSVNLLPTRLQDRDIVDKISDVLEKTALPPEVLVLEITESALLSDIDAATARLRALRALGVQIALDDFGTGYSSLAYLRRFPVSIVKIDRVFIDGLVQDSEETAFVEAILKFGLGLGLEVVAEGVETRLQLDTLRRLGCRLGQGFHLCKPIPEPELLTLIESGAPVPGLV